MTINHLMQTLHRLYVDLPVLPTGKVNLNETSDLQSPIWGGVYRIYITVHKFYNWCTWALVFVLLHVAINTCFNGMYTCLTSLLKKCISPSWNKCISLSFFYYSILLKESRDMYLYGPYSSPAIKACPKVPQSRHLVLGLPWNNIYWTWNFWNFEES